MHAMARAAGVSLHEERSAGQALADDVQKTGRSDCRKAYAEMGLLAPLALLHDTLTDKGCKW